MVEFTVDEMAKQPVGYQKWVFLGSPLTPDDMISGEALSPEFLNTFMDTQSFAHVEKTGEAAYKKRTLGRRLGMGLV